MVEVPNDDALFCGIKAKVDNYPHIGTDHTRLDEARPAMKLRDEHGWSINMLRTGFCVTRDFGKIGRNADPRVVVPHVRRETIGDDAKAHNVYDGLTQHTAPPMLGEEATKGVGSNIAGLPLAVLLDVFVRVDGRHDLGLVEVLWQWALNEYTVHLLVFVEFLNLSLDMGRGGLGRDFVNPVSDARLETYALGQ